MALTPHSRNYGDFFPKDMLQGWKLEHNPAHLALYAMLSWTTYIFLVGQHPGTKSPAALRRLCRCAGYVLYSILVPSTQHNAYKKRECCQRSTKVSFGSQGTRPQLQNRPKRLFFHRNKGQLQSDTGRSTNEVIKQDVTQKNRLYRSVLCSRPTPCNRSLLQAQSNPTFFFK